MAPGTRGPSWRSAGAAFSPPAPVETGLRSSQLARGTAPGRTPMFHRSSIGAAALAALLCMQVAGAWAQNATGPKESGAKDSGAKDPKDTKAFPNWEGLWGRGSPVGAWDPTKPPGAGQQPPLTAEYQKVFESNLAKGKAGVVFDIKGTCGPVGMPRLMILYEPMLIQVKPKLHHLLFEMMIPLRPFC